MIHTNYALTYLFQGTWQFLSVALLSGPKEVEICDELEAFFYVLLYYGVRYLRSNIHDSGVGTWISTFFDTYGVQDDAYICGNEKLIAMNTGRLGVSSTKNARKYVEFEGPFDGVIKDLLTWFKAYRVVSEYEREQARLESLRHLIPQAAPVSTPLEHKSRKKARPDGMGDTAIGPDESSKAQSVDEPTAEDWKFAKHVLTHAKMAGRLEKALEDDDPTSQWTADDKVGDRAAKDFRPPALPAGPTLPATLASNKRRKADKPVVAASLPAMPARLPPKTPERKRAGVPHHTMVYGRQKHH